MEERVNINGKDVVVKKLALKKYAELLAAFEELPKHLNLIQGKSQDEVLVNLPKLLSTCYPDIVRVIRISTDLTEEEIDAMGLDDFVNLITVSLRVNNYSQIYENIKKMTARPHQNQNVVEPVASGSGGQ